jgi:hypothetical protein
VQLDQVNELLLLGDPVVLAPADDMPAAASAASAAADAAANAVATGAVGNGSGGGGSSSSQEAVEGNALLQAGLAQELAASGRGLLASSFQDAAQRCSLAFRWGLAQPGARWLAAGALRVLGWSRLPTAGPGVGRAPCMPSVG